MTETAEPQSQEALQYWGYLFQENKCGTELLNRLLTGIANYITTNFEPSDCPDITPSQLATFYRSVGGNYDVLFVDTLPSSIAFIYKSLGCLHSLQPLPTDDGYCSPSVPALKSKGFIAWQTIQLLLGPEEHVPFLQAAVTNFDILDPKTGQAFPKILPKESFPDKPDQAMLDWYEGVSERLRKEAEAEEKELQQQAQQETRGGGANKHGRQEPTDSRSTAFDYFSNPLYRDPAGRPAIVRRYSRAPREYLHERSSRPSLTTSGIRHFLSPHNWADHRHGYGHRGHSNSYSHADRGRADDNHRRRSLPERERRDHHLGANPGVSATAASDVDSDPEPTPTGLHPRYVPAASRSSAPPPSGPPPPQRLRRDRSPSSWAPSDISADADAEEEVYPDPYLPSIRAPTLRHRRSDEPPPSPRLTPEGQGRRFSAQGLPGLVSAQGSSPGFGPSKSPLFATHVAQSASAAQLRPESQGREGYFDWERRGSSSSAYDFGGGGRGGGGGGEGYERGYARPSGERFDSGYSSRRDERERDNRARDRERNRDGDRNRDRGRDWDRDRHRDRDRTRPTLHRYVTPMNGVSGRKYPVEAPWR